MPRLRFFGLLTALLLSACADTSGVDYDLRMGHYTLDRMNGQSLPGTLIHNSIAKLEFLSGSLWLHRNGTFSDSTNVKVTALATGSLRYVTDVASGTFSIVGDTLYLTSTRGENYQMTFQIAGSLTQMLSGSTLVYRK
jgi:hypothetical protein